MPSDMISLSTSGRDGVTHDLNLMIRVVDFRAYVYVIQRKYAIDTFVTLQLLVTYLDVTDNYASTDQLIVHDDVIKWKHFPRYWPFVRGIHRSPVNSPHKGQWRGALMFSLICVWIRLSKQSWGWWFETLSRPLWRHCNVLPHSDENSNFRITDPLCSVTWSTTSELGAKENGYVQTTLWRDSHSMMRYDTVLCDTILWSDKTYTHNGTHKPSTSVVFILHMYACKMIHRTRTMRVNCVRYAVKVDETISIMFLTVNTSHIKSINCRSGQEPLGRSLESNVLLAFRV